MGAGEALPVPGVITVGHPTLGDNLTTLDALGGKLLLIALGTVNIMFLWYKALCAYWVLAGTAHETLLVPLPCLVLHLLHTSLEYVTTAITSGGKLCVIARSTVNPVRLTPELFVHETCPAFVTQETSLMPVLLLVRQVL